MVQETFRGGQQRRLQQLLSELNQYLQALGLPQRTLRAGDSEQRLFQEINSAKYQWSRNLPWYQKIGVGSLWKPRPPGEAPPPTGQPPSPPSPTDTTTGTDMGYQPTAEEQARAWRIAAGLEAPMGAGGTQGMSPEEVRSLMQGQAYASRFGVQGQDYAGIYEQVRKDILGTLNEPADWIKKWQLQNAPNPYKQQEPSLTELQEELKERQGWVQEIAKRANDPNDPLTWGRIMNPQTTEEQLAGIIFNAYKGTERQILQKEAEAIKEREGVWYEPVTTEEGMKVMVERGLPEAEPARPTTPPAPEWLSQFAPSQRAGQPISKTQIPTPSGQSLTRTPWSQLQGLAGYVGWSGGSWRDILGQAELMQPRTPVEAGRTRWRPARQFA